jgi:hypothetical protein
MAAPVVSYSAGAPATYVTSKPTVTYATAPQAAYTLGSQLAMDWSATGVPVRSMAYPAGGSVSAAPVVAAPAVFACPPEIFAKLAAGGQLTPDEMAMLTGQAAPAAAAVVESAAAAVAEAPAAAVAATETAVKAAKSASKKKSSKKKDSLKASSKKAQKGCC